jgi:transposase
MAKPSVSDALWKRVEPLLPRIAKSSKGGRRPVGNCEALTGILFVLRSGMTFETLGRRSGRSR